MKIAIGSDHRGFDSKEHVKTILTQLGHQYIDVGMKDNSPSDYPEPAYLAAKAVVKGQVDRAILICGTGIGMCIAANKVKGIRAALCHDELSAQISREHNDSNVLCLSGDMVGQVLLRKIVEVWLNSKFQGGRHLRRVNKISAIEDGKDPFKIKG
jgi:ribose 5-phosphate isomerase B